MRRIRFVAILLLISLITPSLAACAGPALVQPAPTETQTTGDPAHPDLSDGAPDTGRLPQAISDVQREVDPPVTAETLTALAAGNNAFAFDLYRALAAEQGNLFFSPHSITSALAMLYAGAQGQTADQMADVLHYDLPPEQLHPAFNALDRQLNQAEDNPFQLSIANSLWGQQDFPFLPEFLDTLARSYGAGVRLVDFTGEEGRETARQAINGWVAEETEGRIEELIERGVFNEMTRLVLTNVIYFRAEWQEPFLNGTRDEPFYLPDGTQVDVPLMSRRAQTPYLQGEDYQAVALPYQGGRMEMVVIKPDAGQFPAVEQSINASTFDQVLNGLVMTDVKLYLPRFEVNSSLTLGETLPDLGMPDAFDPVAADFNGVYRRDLVGQNMFIAHAIHKAFVTVDEMGTEAAAATGLVEEIASLPVTLRVDRPFLFAIRDRQTGSVLFVGRVLDPRG